MTIKEFEDEFHLKWSDPESEALAAKELADEEASIEQNNLDYENGKSSFSEKLKVLSALPRDQYGHVISGLLNADNTCFSAISPNN